MTSEIKENPSGAVHPLPFLALWALLGFGLQYLIPLPFPAIRALEVVAVALWVVGGVLVVAASYELRKHGTTDRHDQPTTALVTNGVFRFSRHPIYLGLTAIMLGMSLRYGSWWALVMTVAVVVALQLLTMPQEEAYLEREFGDDYRAYQSRVRQWL